MKRLCTYCPRPGADVCVRTWSTGDGASIHVYAHRACADARGVIPMYSILDEPAREEGVHGHQSHHPAS